MVNATTGLIGTWILCGASMASMCLRIWLRKREPGSLRQSLRLSDYIMMMAFLCVVGSSAIYTNMSTRELRFVADPKNEKDLVDEDGVPRDAPLFAYEGPDRVIFYKTMYALFWLYLVTLWIGKASILTLYYEIFPKRPRYRWMLRFCLVVVVSTGVAAMFQTIFWCQPVSSFWTLTREHACNLKLEAGYTRTQAGVHISSTGLLIILPLAIFTQIRANKTELMFALTTLALGTISIAVSVGAYLTLLEMGKQYKNSSFRTEARHAALLLSIIDLNVVFLAGCLSALKIRFEKKLPAIPSDALVIEVEQSWTVQVEMMTAWDGGRQGQDKGFGTSSKGVSMQRGRKQAQDIEVVQLTRGSETNSRGRSESAMGFV